MEVWPRIEALIERHGASALVSVVAARGSVPREAGARMIVRPDGAFHGTIGGGALEWQALAKAQALIGRRERALKLIDQALGPDLGQCCGGHVTLAIELFDAADLDEVRRLAAAERVSAFSVETIRDGERYRRTVVNAGYRVAAPSPAHFVESFGERRDTIVLFGAGHVGRALVLALAPLPFAVIWCDAREGAFPAAIPTNVTTTAGPPLDVLAQAPDGAQVLVMTHSHALDLDLVAAALGSGRFPHVGLIGSATKKARFVKRMREIGIPASRIAHLHCPIGLPSIRAKEPAVIAASVAAECLILREARSITVPHPLDQRRPA
jgi:xanthine dehydrogenase accessory factor